MTLLAKVVSVLLGRHLLLLLLLLVYEALHGLHALVLYLRLVP